MATNIPTENAPQLRNGLKPNDDPRPLIPEINQWQDDTLIVSHLPFVPTLISLLNKEGTMISMIPGTIVYLNNEAGNWQIEWVESP